MPGVTPPGPLGAPLLSDEERRKVETLREDKDGYLFSVTQSRPLGRLYTSARSPTTQYQTRCMNSDHCGCQRWISSRRAPDPTRLKLWLVEGYDLADSKAHLDTFAAVVKPL